MPPLSRRDLLLLQVLMMVSTFVPGIHVVLGERRCPRLAAQEGDPASLDLTSFSATLDLSGNDFPASGSGSGSGDQVELITGGEVSPTFDSESSPMLTDYTISTSLTLHLRLTNSSHPIMLYYLLNVWSAGSGTAPLGCPTSQGQLVPGGDSLAGVQLGCEGEEDEIIQVCLTIGTSPFDELRGIYKTLELYLHRKCRGPMIANGCGVRDQDEVVPGQICITLNQSQELVSNPIGSWGVLLSALTPDGEDVCRGYCVIDEFINDTSRPGLATFVDVPSLRPMFPIAEQFPELEMYVALVTGAQAMAFSMLYFSANTSVLNPPFVEPLTQGVIHKETLIYLNLPCVRPGTVEVPAVINMSTVLMNTLYFYSYSFSIFRNCTPASLNNGSMTEQPSSKPTDMLRIRLLASLIPVAILLLITVVVSLVVVLLTKRVKRREVVTLQRLKSLENLSSNNAYKLATIRNPLDLLVDLDIEYNYASLQIEYELGEGAFGRVFKARAPGLERDGFVPEFVAVKTLKDGDMTEEFCKEVKAVVKLNHPNIVRLVAVCSSPAVQKCMIFEYMDQGSLDNLLRKSNPDNIVFDDQRRNEEDQENLLITPREFLNCSVQVARGVAYLAKQKYVHRDIASRNCLVNKNLVIKIGDFGLSRDLSSMDYYRVGGTQASLPVRWMPPEALLFGKFTTQSDVWSFGMLMWEIYTFGRQPYTGLSNHEVIDAIKGSKILECPKLCPASVFHAMKMCWTRSPVKRPNMDVVVARLERLLTPSGEDGSQGSVGNTEDGRTVYVNLEYGAQVVEQEELEEIMRVEKRTNEEPLTKLTTNGTIINNGPTEEEEEVEPEKADSLNVNTETNLDDDKETKPHLLQ